MLCFQIYFMNFLFPYFVVYSISFLCTKKPNLYMIHSSSFLRTLFWLHFSSVTENIIRCVLERRVVLSSSSTFCLSWLHPFVCIECLDYCTWEDISTIGSVQFSCSVMSDSLRPHESQHTRPPCPSPPPGVHSDSRPSSQ